MTNQNNKNGPLFAIYNIINFFVGVNMFFLKTLIEIIGLVILFCYFE